MTDEQLREQIDLYAAGMLDEEQRRIVEDAVAQDSRAGQWLQESRRLWTTLDDYHTKAPNDEPAQRAAQRVLRLRRRRSRWLTATAAAASVALAAATYQYVHQASSTSVTLNAQDREIIRDLGFLEHLDMLEQIDLVRNARLLTDLQESRLAEFLEVLAS